MPIRNQLENAILNLAVNARDAMPDGGKLTIETANAHLDEAYAADAREVLAGPVRHDRGERHRHRHDARGDAREPSSRSSPPSRPARAPGSACRQVYGFVKQSGGHVKIYSEPGHGTTVKLYLPRFRQADERAEHRSDGAPPSGLPCPMGRARRFWSSRTRRWCVSSPSTALEEAGYRVLARRRWARRACACSTRTLRLALLFTDVVLPGR